MTIVKGEAIAVNNIYSIREDLMELLSYILKDKQTFMIAIPSALAVMAALIKVAKSDFRLIIDKTKKCTKFIWMQGEKVIKAEWHNKKDE